MHSLFTSAIRENNVSLVRDLLGNGIDVNRGQTPPICIALKEKNTEVVGMLLENGADLTASGRYGDSPIMVAIQTGSRDLVDLLVRAGVEVNASSCKKDSCTPLYMAVMHQHSNLVSYLLDAGALVNQPSPQLYSGNTPLHRASCLKTSEGLVMVNILLAAEADVKAQNDDKQTPLHMAAQEGNCEAVKRLLQCGAELDKMDKNQATALSVAAATGHEEVVRLLCVAGGSINMANKSGRTPLHMASIARHLKVMKTLISFGATVDKANPLALDRSPLLEVIKSCPISSKVISKLKSIPPTYCLQVNKEIEVLDTLVDSGANISYQDREGNSALHLCIRHGSEEVADYLINKAIDPSLVNHNGHTALSLACVENMDSILVKLIQLCPTAVRHPNHGLHLKMGTKSPLIHLVKHSNIKSLRLLMEAGYRPTKGELDIYENAWTSSSTKCTMDRELGNPWSLQRASRVAIRNLLKMDLNRKLFKLPIPDKLREEIVLQSPYMLHAADI